jgi:hypothetical protein
VTVEEAMLSLASLAARTVVAAAATSGWEAVKSGLARLFGRNDAARTELAERRLREVRTQLGAAANQDLERVQEQLAAAWQARIMDLLEETPEIAAELQALVEQAQRQIPAVAVYAAGRSVAAGRDVAITASRGGIAAWTVHGSVTTGNPTGPGLANH